MTITLPGGCPLLAEGHVVHRLSCSSQGLFPLFSIFVLTPGSVFFFSFYSLTLIAKALLHVWSLDVRWKSTWKLTGFSSTAAFRVEPYNIKMYASQWLKGVITGWFDCLGVPHLFSDLSYHCKHKLIITLLMFFNFVLFFVQWDNCNLFCTWTSALNSGVVSYVENQRTITSTANARCLSFWAL